MQFFVDTAEIEEIIELNNLGLIDGVTTNPSLIARSGRDFKETIAEICKTVTGPVSAEVVATDFDSMIAESKCLAGIADNVVIKLPLTLDGLKACRKLTEEGIKTNVTLCFSAGQALLAAKAGATYISPFIGRLDDANIDGMALIQDTQDIYSNYNFQTKILVASIRSVNHVTDSAIIGADAATIPPAIIRNLAQHVLTDKGLDQFTRDWQKTGQSIL